MKYTVEMTEVELKEFLKFREGRAEEEKESVRLTRAFLKLKSDIHTFFGVPESGDYYIGEEDIKKLYEFLDKII